MAWRMAAAYDFGSDKRRETSEELAEHEKHEVSSQLPRRLDG